MKSQKKLIALITLFYFAINLAQNVYPEQNLSTSSLTSKVVPNGFETTPVSTYFSGTFDDTAKTYQLIIAASQLTNLINNQLTSIAFRSTATVPLFSPSIAYSYANYDIYLAQSVAPQNRSFTFNNNIVGTKTQVKSGVLTIPAGSFPTGSSPNDFGYQINFNSSYLYTGGNLVIEIRHSGYTATVNARPLSAAVPATTTGYGTLFTGCFALTYNATAAVQQATFAVIKINGNNPLTSSSFNKINLSVFPNPANDKLNISSDFAISNVQVSNLLGQIVLDKKINPNEDSLDISNLAVGLYNIKVESAEGTKNLKFLKN